MTISEKNFLLADLERQRELVTKIIAAGSRMLKHAASSDLSETSAYKGLVASNESTQKRLDKISTAINYINRTDATQLTMEAVVAILGREVE